MEISSITQRRGFELEAYPGSFSIILVKAQVDDVSRELAKILEANVIQDVYSNFEKIQLDFILVWQYVGHSWSIFHLNGACRETVSMSLSKNMQTDCIYFQYEDTSAWTGYNLFRNGRSVEVYDFGLDYRGEMAELFEELGNEIPEESNNGVPWDINTTDEEGHYQFLFRSRLRSVLEDDIKHSDQFLNEFFTQQEALLPDWNNMPWVEENSRPTLPKSLFVNVNCVEGF